MNITKHIFDNSLLNLAILFISSIFLFLVISQFILYSHNVYALTWNKEDVEKYVGKFTSIAVDSQGRPHISYYDNYYGYLKYAVKDGNSWFIENVTKVIENVGRDFVFTSIAVDSQGRPHISYYDYDNGLLNYAVRYGSGNWTIMTVDPKGFHDSSQSIAIDSADNPHLSYHGGNEEPLKNGYLKYAVKYGNGTWTTEIVDSDGDTGYLSSIAIDSSNNPHISFGKYPSLFGHDHSILKYASKSNGSWTTETINEIDDINGYTSIAIDSSNNPHISYFDENTNFTKYTSMSNGSWTTEVVDSTGNAWHFNSLTLDSSNTPHISYFDMKDKDLKYASKSNGSWTTEVVDSSHDVGRYSSIALNSNNNTVHISYYNATFPWSLKHAYAIFDNMTMSWPAIELGEINILNQKLKVTAETKCTESVANKCLHMELVRLCVGNQCIDVPPSPNPPVCPACNMGIPLKQLKSNNK